MGGRVALELALADARARLEPQPADAGARLPRRRELVPLVKLLRPELAAIPHTLRQAHGPRRSSGACSRGPSGSTRPPPTSPATSSAGLPLARRAHRLLRRRPQHLPRRPVRRARLLDPAARARAPGAVRLGRPGPARPGGVLAPRRRGAARRRAGDARRLRPRAPGRAARGDQRADRRDDRRSASAEPMRRLATCARQSRLTDPGSPIHSTAEMGRSDHGRKARTSTNGDGATTRNGDPRARDERLASAAPSRSAAIAAGLAGRLAVAGKALGSTFGKADRPAR